MITKTTQITEVSIEELADKVADKLIFKNQNCLDDLAIKQSDVFLTRQETTDFLKINSTALWHWTNKGKVVSYGIGNGRY